VALEEAAAPAFADYARAVVENARVLAETLLERGFDLVSGGTDNHLILIDLTAKGITGKRAARALDRAGLVANYNTVPFDPRKPFDPSGLRLGTPALTSRGMGGAEMRRVGVWIDRAVCAAVAADEAALDTIAAEVAELTARFPAPGLDPACAPFKSDMRLADGERPPTELQ